jgi:ribonuclease HI
MAKKYYVVWSGRRTGVFDDWETTRQLVDGHPGARYKSFPTLAEAQSALRAGAPRAAPRKVAKRVAANNEPPSNAQEPSTDTVIFCDGACEPNPGSAGSGMAVYRDGELSELWYGLYNPAGTNNIAELNALHQALLLAEQEIESNRTVLIRSDSVYGLNAITKWAAGWEQKGWRRTGGEIMNLELIKKIYADFCRIGSRVQLKHVSAHVGIEGNELADRMAMYAVDQREPAWRPYPEPIDIKKILRMRAG